uniref:Chemosensory protein n=1 Tax=Leucinodes orbonalis TaxID=711050 RepID=A0AAU0QLJ5_9NEOP|nr:chemosensory protein [Leucinodes orbonalis]
MKLFLVACVLALAGAAFAARVPRYTEIYDTIDVPQILSNRRLLVPYVLCVLDEGKCTPPGRELKSHIKEALETECAKCSPAQVKGTRLVIGHLINHEPDFWNKLVNKYDPNHQYTKKYEQELRKV